MYEHHIYYLILDRTNQREKVDCQVASYVITILPMNISGKWEKRLKSGNRWIKKLFRFFYLRKKVRGKGLVVISDELKNILPRDLYYENMVEDFGPQIYEGYALDSLNEIVTPLAKSNQIMHLLAILPEEGCEISMMEAILEMAKEVESVYMWSYSKEESEWINDKLENLMEETGCAGMSYDLAENTYDNPFRVAGKRVKTNEYVILLDFSDRPLCQLWGLDYYIDGCGSKTKKEIKMLTGRRVRVKELRNYLDRAFYARIY